MLTPTGRGVAAGSTVALLLGWLGDTPELVIVGLAGLAAMVQAGVWMLSAPDLLAVRDIEPVRVAEQDPARAVLLVRNVGRRRSPPILAVERMAGRRIAVPVPSLRAGGSHDTTYPLPTDRRGVFEVGPFSIGHSDPLRLLSTSTDFASETVLSVHPRVHAVAPIPTGVNRDMEGPTSSSSPRGGVAFHSIRPYEWGDPFRDVHWKKSAQTGQLLVSHKVVPDEPSLMLFLDTCRTSYPGNEFEDAARVAASLCVAATKGGYPLQLRTTGGAVAVSEGGQGVEAAMLDLLAGLETKNEDPGLSALAGMAPGRAAVSIGVVTCRPGPSQLSILPSIRPSYLMASLIQVGTQSCEPAAQLRGVFSLSCRDSEDFARQWNARVAR